MRIYKSPWEPSAYIAVLGDDLCVYLNDEGATRAEEMAKDVEALRDDEIWGKPVWTDED